MILQNQIRCLKCKDEPSSSHRHDYVECACGAVAVAGGLDYLKRIGDSGDWKDISITIPAGLSLKLTDMIYQAVKNDGIPNAKDVLCAIARALRDNGYEIRDTNELSS
jgi:hypothetical protein